MATSVSNTTGYKGDGNETMIFDYKIIDQKIIDGSSGPFFSSGINIEEDCMIRMCGKPSVVGVSGTLPYNQYNLTIFSNTSDGRRGFGLMPSVFERATTYTYAMCADHIDGLLPAGTKLTINKLSNQTGTTLLSLYKKQKQKVTAIESKLVTTSSPTSDSTYTATDNCIIIYQIFNTYSHMFLNANDTSLEVSTNVGYCSPSCPLCSANIYSLDLLAGNTIRVSFQTSFTYHILHLEDI